MLNIAQAPPLQSLPVTAVALTTVKPLHKTEHVEMIDPTFMDLMNKDMFFPVFFAYRLGDKSTVVYSRLLNQIKESLQKVLVTFFGFAGRWIASGGGGGRQLLCNDKGVPFIEAYVDEHLDSVVKASAAFRPVPELQGYNVLGMDMRQFQQTMPPDGLPCVFAQVTRFKCGGLVLAITFNHCHTDGHGFYSFTRAWSDLCRTNETAVKVDHNRELIDIPSFKDLVHEQTDNPASNSEVDSDGARSSRRVPWAMKAFEVRSSIIKSLKEDARNDKDEGGYVSTVDCIVAHIWRSLSRLPSSLLGDRELSVGTDVEGRNRFYDPPIPDLCGNVLAVMSMPQISSSELQDMHLASIAKKVREKLQTTRMEEWLGLGRFRESIAAFECRKYAVVPTTSWFNFPMYEIEFGFGKPFYASGVNNLCSSNALGVANILPSIPSSSSSMATVYIWSTPEVLQALECDPQFLPFFLPDPTGDNETFKEKECH